MKQFLYELLKKMVENTPNDRELGEKIRKLYNDQLKETKWIKENYY